VRNLELAVLFVENGELGFQVARMLFFSLPESALGGAILSPSALVVVRWNGRRARLGQTYTRGCVCSLGWCGCGDSSKGRLNMLQWSGTAVWAVVIGAEIRGSHWHGIGSELHGLIDDLGIVCVLYLGGKLIICGRDLLKISIKEGGGGRVVEGLPAIR
jgi:hypothetical protein